MNAPTETGPDVAGGGSRNVTYQYDELYRLKGEIAPDRAVSYTYDKVGNRLTMRVIHDTGNCTEDTYVQYAYDEHDRLTAETRVLTVALNAEGWRGMAGRVPSAHPERGLAGFALVVLTLLVAPLLVLRGLLAVGFTDDGYISRRTRRVRLIALTVLAYMAPLLALDPATIDRWFGDLAIRRAYAQCADPRVEESAIYYEYDANGNLSEKWVDSDGPSGPAEPALDVRYVYDAQNRLILSDPSPEDSTYDDIVVYRYDHDGLRAGKAVGGDTFRYIVDRNRPYAQVLEERKVLPDDGNPQTVDETPVARYTHGDDLIAQERFDTTTGQSLGVTWYHYDGQTSTRQMTDVCECTALLDAAVGVRNGRILSAFRTSQYNRAFEDFLMPRDMLQGILDQLPTHPGYEIHGH